MVFFQTQNALPISVDNWPIISALLDVTKKICYFKKLSFKIIKEILLGHKYINRVNFGLKV